MFINYGQVCYRTEYNFVSKHADKLNKTLIIKNLSNIYENHSSPILSGISGKKSQYEIPGRNLLFISAAVAEALMLKLKSVHTGLFESMYCDASSKFVNSLGLAVRYMSNNKLYLHNPFQYFKKEEIVSRGVSLGIDLGRETFSCYLSMNKKHCGNCMACIARNTAFKKAGVKDTTTYEMSFD